MNTNQNKCLGCGREEPMGVHYDSCPLLELGDLVIPKEDAGTERDDDDLAKDVFDLVEEAHLKRNTLLTPGITKKFVGKWVAVPEEDFYRNRRMLLTFERMLKNRPIL